MFKRIKNFLKKNFKIENTVEKKFSEIKYTETLNTNQKEHKIPMIKKLKK